MLIRFSVENFKSFSHQVVLDMTPAKSRLHRDHIISDAHPVKTSLLPISLIYGANAGGKSNFVSAFVFCKRLIVEGTTGDKKINIDPYAFDSNLRGGPSRFNFLFKTQGVIYDYGFSLNQTKILEEWLFARYGKKEEKIFERLTGADDEVKVEPGLVLEKESQDINFIHYVARGTRRNQLFLTEASQKNIKCIKPVMQWFNYVLQVISPDSSYSGLPIRAHKDNQFLHHLEKFLRTAGTGIDGVMCEVQPFDVDKHLLGAPDEVKRSFKEEVKIEDDEELVIQIGKTMSTIRNEKDKGLQYYNLKTKHKNNDGTMTAFSTANESDGTLRLMNLAPMLYNSKTHECVFIIDEIDRSLHENLSKFLISSIIDGTQNKAIHAQFVMTTHDTNLLDRKLLRRDEILFMEKDKSGNSKLTPLADFRITDGLNIQNGYLNGRFGATPLFGPAKNIFN